MIRTGAMLAGVTASLLALAPLTGLAAPKDLDVLGWVEWAYLPEVEVELKAKLDTGAETSSLDARIIKKFRKSGKRWVRFAVDDPETGEEHIIVRERVRTIGVVQHDGSRQTRPVVTMEVCIDGHRMQTEVSLIDRSEFIYPLLMGRAALASFTLVDSGSTFLGEPGCPEPPAEQGSTGE